MRQYNVVIASIAKRCEAILFVILIVFFLSMPTYAEIPPYMQFQGKATDIDDTPLNGTYNITFRIYDSETAGNLEWSEAHNGVQIENGVFSVLLGGTNPLNVAFDEPYWISIDINATGEMPRQRITSAGYAYRAETADYANVAETINELVIENRTSDPVSPKTGQIWFRTDL